MYRLFHVEISPNAPAQQNVVVFCHVVLARNDAEARATASSRGVASNAHISNVYAVN